MMTHDLKGGTWLHKSLKKPDDENFYGFQTAKFRLQPFVNKTLRRGGLLGRGGGGAQRRGSGRDDGVKKRISIYVNTIKSTCRSRASLYSRRCTVVRPRAPRRVHALYLYFLGVSSRRCHILFQFCGSIPAVRFSGSYPVTRGVRSASPVGSKFFFFKQENGEQKMTFVSAIHAHTRPENKRSSLSPLSSD